MPKRKSAGSGNPTTVSIDRDPEADTVKGTIVFTRQNHQRLGIFAALRKCDRSTIVNEILDIALEGVKAWGKREAADELRRYQG
jgi:argonaute-like protein implicated in RNA metabolism and viral defense